MTKKLTMVIDLQACTGCNTCTVACKQENNLPEGVSWTQVISLDENGDFLGEAAPSTSLRMDPSTAPAKDPSTSLRMHPSTALGMHAEGGSRTAQLDYLPLACQHCANSPCTEVCPRSAAYRDEEWGIVMQDPSLCIGCRYCLMVCPYTSVRVYSGEGVRFSLPFPTGENPIAHRPKSVEKCTFCLHRLQRGLQPACVEACPIEARAFGDRSDPTSEVSELLRTRAHFQLLVEKGTEPSVFYLT